MARLHTGRHKVLTTYRSYHGATGGAITVTGDPRRWPSETGMSGVVKFWGPYPYRSAFHADRRGRGVPARAASTCADVLMVEGAADGRARSSSRRSSARTASSCRRPATSQGVRELCDEFGIMLIADEVMAGFGRCGEWFAVPEAGASRPDLDRASPRASTAATCRSAGWSSASTIADTFKDRQFPGGLTYSGHLLGLRDRPSPASTSSRRRASSSTPGCSAPTSSAPRSTSCRPSTRRSARSAGSACSGRSSSSRNREHPRAARAVQRRRRRREADGRTRRGVQGARACGRSPTSTGSTSCRRCNTPVDEVLQGIDIIDEVLDLADARYDG